MDNILEIIKISKKYTEKMITISPTFLERETLSVVLQAFRDIEEIAKNKNVEFKELQKENKELKNKLKELSK